MSRESEKKGESNLIDLERLPQVAQAELSAAGRDVSEVEIQERKQQITITQAEVATVLSDSDDKSRRLAKIEIATLEKKFEEVSYKLHQLKTVDATRDKYVGRLFWLIVAWLFIVVIFVALTATLGSSFHLSDSVLIAFITSTTLGVLGLFVIVARWLFPSANDKGK